MKVLKTCTPGLGPFHPMVPLALALRAAGHEVTFVISESFRPWIERTGVVLDEPIYRLNAQRIGREIGSMPAPADVVGLPEQLARNKAPIPNPSGHWSR